MREDYILTVSIGNTRIAVGLCGREGVVKTARWSVGDLPGLERHVVSMTDRGAIPVAAAVVGSVNPPVTADILRWAAEGLRVPCEVVGQHLPIPLPIRCDHPQEVGVDRLMNAVAAIERTGRATAIVDLGTAITVDVVSGCGEFLGGLIAPGLAMSARALHEQTALLPLVEFEPAGRVIGKNTVAAIRAGLHCAVVGLIECAVRRLADEVGEEVAVIATGGDATRLAELSPIIETVAPDLTLEGLHLTWLRAPRT